jgi:acyl transferase domain-containing protein
MFRLGLVFPGQGSQYVGMGSDLYREFAAARDVFDRAREILGFDVASLCFEGPREALDLTVNTQTVVLTLDIAIYEAFRREVPLDPAVLAGHSLGEYAALYAAGALSLALSPGIVDVVFWSRINTPDPSFFASLPEKRKLDATMIALALSPYRHSDIDIPEGTITTDGYLHDIYVTIYLKK